MDKSEFPSDFAVDGRIEDGTRTDDVLGMEFAIGDMGGTAGSAVRNLTREYQICVVRNLTREYQICVVCIWMRNECMEIPKYTVFGTWMERNELM